MKYSTEVMAGLTLSLALTSSLSAIEVHGNIALSGTQTNSANVHVSGILDYAHAIPVEQTVSKSKLRSKSLNYSNKIKPTKSGFKPGNKGNGEKFPEKLPILPKNASNIQKQNIDNATPSEYGTSNHPFSTSRIDMFEQRLSRKYPHRVAGKLYFNKYGSTYVCSAASIDKGIVVTAAHCVSDFGENVFYSNFVFIPAFYAGQDTNYRAKAPYGKYGVKQALAMNSYLDGTDNCAQTGVVCENDVAVLVMKKRPNPDTGTNMFPGERTGWFGYGWGSYSFSNFKGDAMAHITQLGYPVSHDRGWMMQRNDSFGYINYNYANNTVIGSRETGGSSGGPWIVNYGEVANLYRTVVGADADSNVVVGTTSWGWPSSGPKEQGASPFTANNIKLLIDEACRRYPANCD